MLSQSFASTSNIAKSETVRFVRPVVRRNFLSGVMKLLKCDIGAGLASFSIQEVAVLRPVRRIGLKVPIGVVRKRLTLTVTPTL